MSDASGQCCSILSLPGCITGGLGGPPKTSGWSSLKSIYIALVHFFFKGLDQFSLSFFFFSKTDLVNSNKGMVKKKVLLFSFSSFG